MEHKIYKVEGMSCQGCERSVESALKKLSGVNQVKADHVAKTVAVEWTNASPDLQVVKQTVEKAGYRFIE
jgi:copper chaperone CopZ